MLVPLGNWNWKLLLSISTRSCFPQTYTPSMLNTVPGRRYILIRFNLVWKIKYTYDVLHIDIKCYYSSAFSKRRWTIFGSPTIFTRFRGTELVDSQVAKIESRFCRKRNMSLHKIYRAGGFDLSRSQTLYNKFDIINLSNFRQFDKTAIFWSKTTCSVKILT